MNSNASLDSRIMSSSDKIQRWTLPNEGTVKVNTDIAWYNSNLDSATTIIIRNHKGQTLVGQAFKILCRSPLAGEVLVML